MWPYAFPTLAMDGGSGTTLAYDIERAIGTLNPSVAEAVRQAENSLLQPVLDYTNINSQSWSTFPDSMNTSE